MSASLNLRRVRVAKLVREQFGIEPKPAHDPTLFSLEELQLILETITLELEHITRNQAC